MFIRTVLNSISTCFHHIMSPVNFTRVSSFYAAAKVVGAAAISEFICCNRTCHQRCGFRVSGWPNVLDAGQCTTSQRFHFLIKIHQANVRHIKKDKYESFVPEHKGKGQHKMEIKHEKWQMRKNSVSEMTFVLLILSSRYFIALTPWSTDALPIHTCSQIFYWWSVCYGTIRTCNYY